MTLRGGHKSLDCDVGVTVSYVFFFVSALNSAEPQMVLTLGFLGQWAHSQHCVLYSLPTLCFALVSSSEYPRNSCFTLQYLWSTQTHGTGYTVALPSRYVVPSVSCLTELV